MSGPRLVNICRKCVTSTIRKCSDGTKTLVFGENSTRKLECLLLNFNAKFNLMGVVLSEQFNRVAALRVRRAYQVIQLYQRIYGERFLLERFQRIKLANLHKGKSLGALLSAAVFEWSSKQVTDQEISRLQIEADKVQELVDCKIKSLPCEEVEKWEEIVDSEDFMVWRKFNDETQLFTYRVFGHFRDISARSFFNTQVDLEGWKVWDENTVKVNVIDTDPDTKSELIHWVYKFPYPLANRDYVYVRRYVVDTQTNAMVITAKATEHPAYPETWGTVRVEVYTSQMVIKPHSSFDENGMTYTMTYCDDPKTNFPTMAYKWMASTGVHQFLEKVHQASKTKNERLRDMALTRFNSPSDNLYNKCLWESTLQEISKQAQCRAATDRFCENNISKKTKNDPLQGS